MISWRLAVPAVLVAAIVAGCITYFVVPAPPQQVESDLRLPSAPKLTGRPNSATSTNIQHPSTEEHIDAFQRAAEAILRRAQNAKASAGTDEPLVTGPVPLPKRRPIIRP